MKTQNNNRKLNRTSFLICLFLLALTTPGFSQEAPETHHFTDYIDSGMVLSVLCVIALATFMFVAMFRARNKENQEHKHRHRLHVHRKQAHIDHFKY